jgi:site-specific DNA-methyltransferase (cytosine-N4-specific)
VTLIRADARQLLDHVQPGTVQACVTSPPYWGLRVYGDDQGELGTESLEEYLTNLVAIMRDVRTTLRPDGLAWINLGDTASGSGGAGGDYLPPERRKNPDKVRGRSYRVKLGHNRYRQGDSGLAGRQWCAVPARAALALQHDGWWLRAWVTWAKTSVNGKEMRRPESLHHVNRPGSSSETILLLSPRQGRARFYPSQLVEKGDVWHFSPVRPGESTGHAAPFPDELARRCILPSTLPGDLVLDPFAGSGTVLRVSEEHGRRAIGLDLYAPSDQDAKPEQVIGCVWGAHRTLAERHPDFPAYTWAEQTWTERLRQRAPSGNALPGWLETELWSAWRSDLAGAAS